MSDVPRYAHLRPRRIVGAPFPSPKPSPWHLAVSVLRGVADGVTVGVVASVLLLLAPEVARAVLYVAQGGVL